MDKTKSYQLILAFVLCLNYPLICDATADLPIGDKSLILKYWQYRELFYKHFIIIDRDAYGCIHDGIGLSKTRPYLCSKESYSLPATSLSIMWSGADAFGDRNNSHSVFYDPACMVNVHWQNSDRHNILNLSSETSFQLGWYIMMLATEYENLRRFGDEVSMKKTLEELFLALQTIRRLDIQAQIIFDELYAKRKLSNNNPTCTICPQEFAVDDNHKTLLKTKFNKDCNFEPQLDGYFGFLIREDATQLLGEKLHDNTEGKWNIDAVKSNHAMLKAPCTRFLDERACYLYIHQMFQSQDQILGLLNGLIFVKKYIPASAYVTTCNGARYYPLTIATKIVEALVSRINDDTWDVINYPGQAACMTKRNILGVKNKAVGLNNFEGGHSIAVMYGMKKVLSFFKDKKVKANINEYVAYQAFLRNTTLYKNVTANFFLLLEAITLDKKSQSYPKKTIRFNKQIYLLENDLLYGTIGNNTLEESWYRNLLNAAPCNGLCSKSSDYDKPDPGKKWPLFDCANTPGWVNSQRWESGPDQYEVYDELQHYPRNQIRNGLDFMALFNLYFLRYRSAGFPLMNYSNAERMSDYKAQLSSVQKISLHQRSNELIQHLSWINSDGSENYNLDIDNSTNNFLRKIYMINNIPKRVSYYDKKNKVHASIKGNFTDQCMNFEYYVVRDSISK